MKRNLLFFVFFACFSSLIAFAQDKQKTEMKQGGAYLLDEFGVLQEIKAPMFSFEETEHDFGDLTEGPKAGYSFKFTNVGVDSLKISHAQASCGCTQPTWSKDPIAPGATGEIFVEYNTQGRPGPFTKSITITSNASEPSKVIFIKGKVTQAAPPPATNPTNAPTQAPSGH